MTDDVEQRLARFREDLLGGRGPGASTDEVTRHTRDRAPIGGMPSPRDLALVEQQAELAREDLPAADGIGPGPHGPAFWLLLGALGALLLRAVLPVGPRPRPRDSTMTVTADPPTAVAHRSGRRAANRKA